MRTLVVVESPTKARTLSGFLGKEYNVQSSFGHVRDLPKSKLGIDTEKDFAPSYVIPTKARKVVNELKKEAKKAGVVTLATDEDREGEAIAWHLAQVLNLGNPQRIVFHEITKQAIEDALKNPRDIDINMVNAQQARRVLDRLVGYKLSPFLWQKVARNLSAGRVQSVAVRLIADREKEIQVFVPQEYWTLVAQFEGFEALLKQDIKNKEGVDNILKDLEGAEYSVASIEKKEVRRNPLPPFTTSTLQQTAWQRLHFPAKLTMSVAQQLYEMGFITYHRTDSLNLSQFSLNVAKEYISKEYGKEYWPGFSRIFKTKSKLAQEAHEAIRPTSLQQITNNLTPAQTKLYDLTWTRFIASQMAQAAFDSTAVEIKAEIRNPKSEIRNYTFRATGQILRFDGFLKVYPIKFTETELPALTQNEVLELKELIPSQHFTEPPPRYTEATLVKALEEHGIGRPSTYAPIISTIQDRGYIEKDEQRRFKPTDLGVTVNNLLVEHFPEIVDIKFTADMEEKLDTIAEGKTQWVPMIKEFYAPFEQNLEKKYEEVSKKDVAQEATDKICPQCGSSVVVRLGRFGKFYACSTFPACKYTESLQNNASIGMKCPKCGEGEVATKRTKRGKMFYGCNRYPSCDFASWQKPSQTWQKPKNEVK